MLAGLKVAALSLGLGVLVVAKGVMMIGIVIYLLAGIGYAVRGEIRSAFVTLDIAIIAIVAVYIVTSAGRSISARLDRIEQRRDAERRRRIGWGAR